MNKYIFWTVFGLLAGVHPQCLTFVIIIKNPFLSIGDIVKLFHLY